MVVRLCEKKRQGELSTSVLSAPRWRCVGSAHYEGREAAKG